MQEGHADCRTERAMKETGLTGKRRSTTIAATPDDGNSQRKRRRRFQTQLRSIAHDYMSQHNRKMQKQHINLPTAGVA